MIFVLSFACISFSSATVFESDGFYYARTSSTTADLYGRSATNADLVIPKDFSEYYVTNIVDSAFSGDENIETLSFGKSMLLERIGYYAFKNCIHLSGPVTFAGRISTIGTSAFEDCTALEKVVFNAYVADIPDQCFYNCTSLSTVVMNDRINSIGKFAFGNTALKEITIPKSVTYIDKTAFDGCVGLVINCYTDSYAHQFAEENGIDYVLLDAPAPTEPPTEPEPTEAPTEAPTEEPTVPATEAPTEVSVKYLGNVDGDGNVTAIDATLIQRYLCNIKTMVSDEMFMMGDVDGDGIITIIDVSFIMRYLATIEVPYPIGEPIINN
ncbi:leucine-rich repeat protein [Ruminococcus sp.]|uniref:leucine-rich repeat protein n=1 Tax=Ruminococcus sp. TaxID=41978 RepID=UPI0038651245